MKMNVNRSDIDLEILKLTIKELKPLLNEIVFLGGSVISLFVDEPGILEIRETFDVDCAIEISHREDYERFAKKLRQIGFSEDINSKIICRFKKGDLIVDVHPNLRHARCNSLPYAPSFSSFCSFLPPKPLIGIQR